MGGVLAWMGRGGTGGAKSGHAVLPRTPTPKLCPPHLPLVPALHLRRAGTSRCFHMQTLPPEDLGSKPTAGTLARLP